MARDRANLRIDMWADDDFRALSVDAQHVYMLLLTHPTLSYAGVADWRPKRLAALSGGNTVERVEAAVAELSAGAFVYVDEDTEEVLVRSFVKHDGLLKHPRLHVTMANDFAGIASRPIRSFFAHEVRKMHAADPSLACWKDKRVQSILEFPGRDLKAEVGGLDAAPVVSAPAAMPKPLAKDSNSSDMRTATATATKKEMVAVAPVLSVDAEELLISVEHDTPMVESVLDGFQAFWDEYRVSAQDLCGAKPGSKPKAQTAYAKLRKDLSASQIMDLCRGYFAGKRRDKAADSRGFVPSPPHAVRWLNEGLWSEYDLDPARVSGGAVVGASVAGPGGLSRAQVDAALGVDSVRPPSPPMELIGDLEGQDAWLAQWRRERFEARRAEAWTTLTAGV